METGQPDDMMRPISLKCTYKSLLKDNILSWELLVEIMYPMWIYRNQRVEDFLLSGEVAVLKLLDRSEFGFIFTKVLRAYLSPRNISPQQDRSSLGWVALS